MDAGVEKSVLKCNKSAMDMLAREEAAPSAYGLGGKPGPESLKQLKEALHILQTCTSKESNSYKRLAAITLNNMACYYKRYEKPNVALQQLQKVLKLEESLDPDEISLARTHLNICAIESSLGKHSSALLSAETALSLVLNKNSSTEKTPSEELGSTMAIAFYNVCAELEHLKQYTEAFKKAQQGIETCEKLLGLRHTLCVKLREFSEEIEKNKTIQEQRFETIQNIKNRQKSQQMRIKARKERSNQCSPFKEYSNQNTNSKPKPEKRSITVERTRNEPRSIESMRSIKTRNVSSISKYFALPEISTPSCVKPRQLTGKISVQSNRSLYKPSKESLNSFSTISQKQVNVNTSPLAPPSELQKKYISIREKILKGKFKRVSELRETPFQRLPPPMKKRQEKLPPLNSFHNLSSPSKYNKQRNYSKEGEQIPDQSFDYSFKEEFPQELSILNYNELSHAENERMEEDKVEYRESDDLINILSDPYLQSSNEKRPDIGQPLESIEEERQQSVLGSLELAGPKRAFKKQINIRSSLAEKVESEENEPVKQNAEEIIIWKKQIKELFKNDLQQQIKKPLYPKAGIMQYLFWKSKLRVVIHRF